MTLLWNLKRQANRSIDWPYHSSMIMDESLSEFFFFKKYTGVLAAEYKGASILAARPSRFERYQDLFSKLTHAYMGSFLARLTSFSWFHRNKTFSSVDIFAPYCSSNWVTNICNSFCFMSADMSYVARNTSG